MVESDLPKLDTFPITNRALGRVPTATGWDTPPTNLENATDGDFDTVTGTAVRTTVGAGTLGNIDIDLGAVYSVLIRCKVGVWSTGAVSVTVYFFYSPDGITYYGTTFKHEMAAASASERILFSPAIFTRGRYLRLNFYATAAMTGNAKVYELQAIDLGV